MGDVHMTHRKHTTHTTARYTNKGCADVGVMLLAWSSPVFMALSPSLSLALGPWKGIRRGVLHLQSGQWRRKN